MLEYERSCKHKMLIASSSKDVKFHTWPDGTLVNTYKCSNSKIEGPIRTISWGKDGTWLVLVPVKGQAEIISIKDNLKHLHTIQEIQQPTCAAFQNATKKNIALGTVTGQVLVYDMKNKLSKKRFPRACGSISKVEYCAKDTHLLAACENGEVLLYNNTNCILAASFKIPNSRSVNTIRCHPSKRSYVAGGSEEGIVAIWDINTNKTKGYTQAHTAPVTDIAFSPIRSDLLASVGMDRKFRFYDVLSNTIVCDCSVEKALTSLDFCSDGISLAVASLDGKIHHYDTRNMSIPQSTFIGHHGTVRNLLFQKQQPDESGLTMQDEIAEHCSTEKTKSAFDSFGLMLAGDQSENREGRMVSVGVHQVHETANDSFLAALGISNTIGTSPVIKEGSSLGISDAIKKALKDKPTLLEIATSRQLLQNISPLVQKKLSQEFTTPTVTASNAASSNTVRPTSSTPDIFTKETPIFISPIVPQEPQSIVSEKNSNTQVPSVDMQQIRDILREEIRSEIQAVKTELHHEFLDMYANMRRQFLDMQMTIVKEFVQLENVLNRLRDDLTVDDASEDEIILQENLRMRRELAMLTEKLREKEN